MISLFSREKQGFVEGQTVSLLDTGYLLGDGVFATMHAYRGVCFRAHRHLAQLARGAELLGIELPAPPEAILAETHARVKGLDHANVRVTLTRGALSVLVRPMNLPTAEQIAHGIATVIVGPRRIPPACIDGTIKTTSYAPALVARREAEARGAVEGIQLAVDGSLACGTMSTLFLVVGGSLLTPSLESGCRAGITREALLELASEVGLEAREQVLPPSMLFSADEAFFANTRIECLPIASVDGRTIAADFPRTHALCAALARCIERER